MAWSEANRVDFLFGLARNDRLVGEIAEQLAEAYPWHHEWGLAHALLTAAVR